MTPSIRRLLCASLLSLPLALASPALAKPVTMHGQTADVTIELDGFAPSLGPGSLGGKYERLGQLQRTVPGLPALNVSVLVDTPPAGFDPQKLPQHVLGSYRARYGQAVPTVQNSAKPAGFWFDFDEKSVAGHTWNLYFETMVQGRWLEIHFSAVNPKPEEVAALRKQCQTVLQSVVFTPKG